jgi:hypothetical protein
LEKKKERRKTSEGRRASFISRESGGRPVHAPCPKQRVAKPGGANHSTEIINFNIIYFLSNFKNIIFNIIKIIININKFLGQ